MENKHKTPDTDAEEKKNQPHESKEKGSALNAASIGRSATSQVDPHSNSGLANTGTNISYEGATAPGAGGSAGTGYTSGKEATGETLATNSDYEEGRAAHLTKEEEKENSHAKEEGENESENDEDDENKKDESEKDII